MPGGFEHCPRSEKSGLERALWILVPRRIAGRQVVNAIASGERSIDRMIAAHVADAELDLGLW